MIEEERDLQHSDPPRLNRCEKQCLAYRDVLHELGERLRVNDVQLLAELQTYCNELATQPMIGSSTSGQPMDIGDPEVEGILSDCSNFLTTRDAFLGFTEDALPSLLVREMQAAQAHIGREGSVENDYVAKIRERCKATLHDLMTADAVARAEASVFAQNPENEQQLHELIESYYDSTYHAGLRECLLHVWPSLVHIREPETNEFQFSTSTLQGQMQECIGRQGDDEEMVIVEGSEVDKIEPDSGHQQQCLLVLTFTSYTCNVGQLLTARNLNVTNIKMLRIGAFESEKTLRSEVDSFWTEDEPHDVLVIQCDAELHSQHLLLTREIMREAEEAYKDVTEAARRPKAQAIILHLPRFANGGLVAGRWEFSHLSEWRQIAVDRLEGEAKDFELLRAARKTRDATGLVTGAFEGGWKPPTSLPIASLSELIQSELPWALRRLAYPHKDVRVLFDYQKAVRSELLNNATALLRIEGRMRRLLDAPSANRTPGHWLPVLALDLGALVKAGCLTTLVREVIVSSVRQSLALLLYQLEKCSALAGLRSCNSATQKAIWLDLFLPGDDAKSVLGNLVLPSQMVGWGTECLVLTSHQMHLKWAFSAELEKRLRSRKARFVEMCAPAWKPEAIASMCHGLCQDFISELELVSPNLLRRLAEVSVEHREGAVSRTSMEEAMDVDLDGQSPPQSAQHHAELAAELEALWSEHKVQFRYDVQQIICQEIASSDQGISADRISTLIDAALRTPNSNDDWHPASVCIQHWRVERLLRHAVPLFLLIRDQTCAMSGDEDFIVELVDRAVRSCLSKPIENEMSIWLATAQRCLNYVRKIEEEDAGRTLSELPILGRLQLCVDFCSRVVPKCGTDSRQAARDTLKRLANPNELAHDKIMPMMKELMEAIEGDAEAISAVSNFQFVWISRELEAFEHHDHEMTIKELAQSLQSEQIQSGQVPPAVGRAVRGALAAMGLFNPYEVRRGNTHCFGCLTSILEKSLLAKDQALAGLVCSELQQTFAAEIANGIEELGCNQDGRPQKRRRTPNGLDDFCESFSAACGEVKIRLSGAGGSASSLYHLAFVKAFVQEACLSLRTSGREAASSWADALEHILSSEEGSDGVVGSLQLFVLRQLRRDLSIDELMQDVRGGELGKLLPSLKSRCASSVVLKTASKLGFDPFVSYGEQYRKARSALQASCDGIVEELGTVNVQYLLFAATTALYLPRSLQGARDVDSVRSALERIIPQDQRESRLGRLLWSVVANVARPFSPRSMVLRPQSPVTDVCLSSLSLHLAAVLDASHPMANPLAMYCQRPAEACEAFVLCAASNENMAAIRASAVREATHANAPARCMCGFMYLIGNCGQAGSSEPCPQCGQLLGGQNHQLASGQQYMSGDIPDADEAGFIVDPNEYGQYQTLRELPVLAFRALHLLVRLSLFSGSIMGHTGLHSLIKGERNATTYCWEAALRDFQLLPALLGHASEQETCAWLHDLIERLPQWCAERGPARNSLTTSGLRQAWESDFATQLVQPHAGRARECMAARPLGEGPRPTLHRLIDEEESVAMDVRHRGLWSTLEQPTLSRLQSHFQGLDAMSRARYPFLDMCLSQLELLNLAQHLWPFLQWERLLREEWSSRIDRGEAREMTVSQLLEQTSDSALRQRTSEAFAAFSAAWAAVVGMLKDPEKSGHTEAVPRYAELCDCHPVKAQNMPTDLDLNDNLIRGLIDPEICADPVGNLFRLFLHMLAKAQNDFLALVVSMVPTCPALIALSLGGNAVWLDSAPQTALLQLQRQHTLLQDLTKVTTEMLSSCLAQTGYGVSHSPARVAFDFSAMESGLAMTLLTGARRVDLEADGMGGDGPGGMAKEAPAVFMFKGELLPRHLDLPRRVSEQMEQEAVANARSLQEEPFLQEPKNCRETLELLELVLYHATKSRPSPDERLVNYCKAFSVVGTDDGLRKRVLQCSAIGEVPLKQLRSLFELVEDIVADAVLPNLPSIFRSPLPDAALADKACLELGRRCVPAGAGDVAWQTAAMRAGRLRLEPALKRFIYRELKESKIITHANLDAPLYHWVMKPDFPWAMGDRVSDDEVDAAFDQFGEPALKHAYELWSELRRRGSDALYSKDWVVV